MVARLWGADRGLQLGMIRVQKEEEEEQAGGRRGRQLCGLMLVCYLESTDLSEAVGEAVDCRWICPATSAAATGRNASSSSESSSSVSESGRSELESEGCRARWTIGKLTSGTTRSSVLGLGRLLM